MFPNMNISPLKLLSLCFVLSLSGISDAWSHTFALGLRAASDEGGVEMWFRTWHGCDEGPLSEGYIRIEGINVNYPEKIEEANLRSCRSTNSNQPPQFELSTDVGYYCEVDSTGQILGKSSGVNTTAKPSLGFDPKKPITGAAFTQKNPSAVGAILCDTDIQGEAGRTSGGPSYDKWHGSSFIGLEPGLYDIEYLECNDERAPRNNCANGSTPSADFQIQHKLIAALPPVDVTEELAGKPPIQILPGDESIAITYYAPDDGTVVDHYEYELDESKTWTTVAPPDELEPVSTGTLLVKESNDTPPSGMAHFSRLTFPAIGPLADRDEVSVKLSHSPSGASSVKWKSKFSVGQRMGFQQGDVFIDGEIKNLIEQTSYTEITLIKTRKLDQRTLVEGEITVGRLLPYEDVARTIKVVELNNSKPYKIRFRAVAVDGTAGDFSEIKTETPLPNCEDVTAAGEGLPCQINGVVYEAADLHVLSTTADPTAAGICGTDASYTDHKLPTSGVILCKQTDDDKTVRAIFDWDNSEPNVALDWLDVVTQMGSRSFGSYNCASRTPSGRCKARLADGYAAFEGMSGAGGDAIKNLDVSDLTDMREMFKDATAVNLDLSAWDISSVDTYEGFDDGADQWCGLGFSNQGRPSDWDAKAQGCLDLNLTTTPEKVVETNDTVIYNVEAFNQTTTDVTSGTLQLVLPTGTQYNAEYTVTQPDIIDGQTLTWNSQNVLEGQRGVELAVVVDVPSSFPGKDMTATATLTDSVSGASVNKVHNIKVGGRPEPLLTLTGPSFVLAGGSLVYDLAYRNSGNRDSLSMTVSLSWDSDTAVVADPSSEDVCSGVPLTCEWTVTVPADETWFKRVTVKVPADTPMPVTLDATARAALPGMRTAVARARTEVDAQPELYIRLVTQPDATVEPNGSIVTETVVKNTGTAAASDVKVSLPLAGTTLQQASAGGSEIDGAVVWSLGSVLPGASVSVLTATLRAPDPAPDPAQLVQITARADGKTPGGRGISEESFAVTVSVTSKPTPELEVAFAPEHYTREAPIDLVFTYQNDSPSEVSGAKLTMLIPKDTSLKATPDGATCYSDRCEKTIGRMASGELGSAVMSLQVDPNARFSISGGGLLSPTVQREFVEQTAVAEAHERQDSGSNDDFIMSLRPNTGSGCTLASMESINASNLAGYNLLTQQFLSFTVDGCDPDAPESMEVVIDVGKTLPAGALLVKLDESSNKVTPIKDAEISGGVATYTLTDQGELDQDPTAGSLRDPVAFVTRITQFPPDAPDALVATPGDTELLITFDMPSANGSDITRFEYSIDEGDAISTNRDEPAFTVTGLTNGTEYSIRVRAVNGVGKSGWSNPVTEAPEAGTAPPDAPIDLSATVSAGDIVISFTPGSDNGAAITDYEAYVDGRDWISTGATDSPAVVKDLPSGNTYEISLRGVNAEGKGSISESIVVTLPLDTDGDGVPDSNDACPTDPSCSALPVPTLPWPILLLLFAIVGWYGKRFLTIPR